MKRILPIIICLGILVSLCACGSSEKTTTSTQSTTAPTTNEGTTLHKTEATTEPTTEEQTIPVPEPISDATPTTEPAPLPTVTDAPTEETTLGKTGEMAFSDSPDNRYIKSIADKYSVNAENLVAIYTVPQNDSNMVLEFSGKTDASGKLVRNSSTLVAIYTIDASLVSKRASKDDSKNEYPSGEAMVMFMTVTTYIMPEFKDKL
jgi:hypothetical protein